jgi:hypothetical protein
MFLIDDALHQVAMAYMLVYEEYRDNMIHSNHCAPNYVKIPPSLNADSVFWLIHGGPIRFYKWDDGDVDWGSDPKTGQEKNGYLGFTETKNQIRIYPYGARNRYFKTKSDLCFKNFIIHEVGHAFSRALNGDPSNQAIYDPDLLTTDVSKPSGFFGTQEGANGCWQRRENGDGSPSEIFADQFVGWVWGWAWEGSPKAHYLFTDLGNKRRDFMNRNMPRWILRKVLDPTNIVPATFDPSY